jgi:two-component system nitrogen regulation response regulator NtrX
MIEAVNKTEKPLALVIDDEISICHALCGVLADEGWRAVHAISGHEGIQNFKAEIPDLVLLDVWMPGLDGIETLQRLKALRDDIPVVIMSGHGTIDTAVKCTKLGAFDFLEKPLSLEKILPMIAHAVELRDRRRTNADFADGVPDIAVNASVFSGRSSKSVKRGVENQFRGVAPATASVRRMIETVGPRNSWVLITGENGTGKEVVARCIHGLSPRSEKPFIAVNCAAIPEDLIESELFGHAKGAFTSAFASKKGKFELANGGTLFLDEIGDMSLRTQAKILRILQEQRFERLGDNQSIDVDVRVLAATNKDLPSEIKAGRFREDLYYRLNVIPVYIPPLRERREDIPFLAEFFLDQLAFELQDPRKQLSDEALEVLMHYPWPGNVRELKNLLERLCIIVFAQEIDAVDLPEAMVQHFRSERRDQPSSATVGALSASAGTFKQAKSDFERNFILDRLNENQWNISRTAEAIGLERSHLHKKLKGWGVDMKKVKMES